MTETELQNKAKALIAIKSTANNLADLKHAYDFMINQVNKINTEVTIEEFKCGDKHSFLAYKGLRRPEKFYIIFNGHLDVVPGGPDQYIPQINNGRLYGRGAYDMKVAALVMADVFNEYVEKVPFPLALQIVTDEESGGRDGTGYQVQRGVRSDFVICGECGRRDGTYSIGNASKGIILAEIGFRGRSSHSAYPWEGDNAAVKAHNFIHALHEKYPVPITETHDSTVTVTAVSSIGESLTTTPDSAVVKINARFVMNDDNLSTKSKFEDFIYSLDPKAKIIKYYDFSAPIYTDPLNPHILNLKAAAEETEKHEFQFVKRHGACDGRFYGEIGIPACEFGIPGHNKHAKDEYVTLKGITNYQASLRKYLDLETISYNASTQKPEGLLTPEAVL